MVFSEGDKAVIQTCWTEKGWGARKIVRKFYGKRWNVVSVYRLMNKFKKQTGTTERKTGNGRLRTATTEENKQYVEENDCFPRRMPWNK